jgi:YqcI/YcgG family
MSALATAIETQSSLIDAGIAHVPDVVMPTPDQLKNFRTIQNATHCPFARAAKIWGAPPYRDSLTLDENLGTSLPLLIAFTCAAKSQTLDGFLFTFPVSIFGNDMASLCITVKRFIEFLMLNDPACPRSLHQEQVTETNWRFHFNAEDFFVNVFAPFYEPGHSRHTYSVKDTIFIMLQPEASFHRRIPKHLYQNKRDEIRNGFKNAIPPQPYTLDDLEVHRFILPEHHDSPPVDGTTLRQRDCVWYTTNTTLVEPRP